MTPVSVKRGKAHVEPPAAFHTAKFSSKLLRASLALQALRKFLIKAMDVITIKTHAELWKEMHLLVRLDDNDGGDSLQVLHGAVSFLVGRRRRRRGCRISGSGLKAVEVQEEETCNADEQAHQRKSCHCHCSHHRMTSAFL